MEFESDENNKNKYYAAFDGQNINICIIDNEILKIEKKTKFKSLYLYQEFIDYDKRFRAFHSIEEIYFFICLLIEKGKVDIIEDKFLVLKYYENDMIIPINHPSKYLFTHYLNDFVDRKLKLEEHQILTVIKTIQEEEGIFSLCLLRDRRLASGGPKKIAIYKENNYAIDFFIYDRATSLCELKNGNLACAGNKDNDIRIWKIDGNNYQLVQSLMGHSKEVFKIIQMEDGKICSCSEDATIKLWENYQCIETLKGYNRRVNSLKEMNDFLIASGNPVDKGVRIWNKYTYKCIKVIEDIYCCWMNALEKLQENTLILGGIDEIFVLDILSFKYTTFYHQIGPVYSICLLRDGRMLLGSYKGQIISYDYLSNQIISIQQTHRDILSCIIETEDNEIFSSSKDKHVNIYI